MNLPMNSADANTSASVTQSENAHRPKMDFWKKRAKATCAWDRDDGGATTRSRVYGVAAAVFAMLALLAAWIDWRALAAYAAAVTLYHLVLGLAVPALVSPGGADPVRVAFHLGVLALATGALVWLTRHLESVFAASARALADAERAGALSEQQRETRDALAASEQERRAEVEAAVAGFRDEIEGELARVAERIAAMLSAAEALEQSVGESTGHAGSAGTTARRRA